MEHLDNDMDDLFQKAGELYPLKTTGSDWDAVAGKLQNESFGDINAVHGLTASGTRNKRKWLLLLLLIPLSFGIVYTSGLIYQKHSGSGPIKPSGNTSAVGGRSKNEKPATNGKTQIYSVLAKHLTTKDIWNGQSKMIPNGGVANKDLNSKNGNKGFVETQAANANKQLINASTSNIEPIQKPQAVQVPLAAAVQNETATTKSDSTSKQAVKSITTDSSTAMKKPAVKTIANKGFYIGFIVGPDISSVDFQSVKQSGFTLGVTVGYRFNKKLSAETGLLFDKKYYYSDGTHYKNQQPGYMIISVDGNCNMFEIPLLLRYDFASGKNHGFFAKAGFSSYLMTKQNYSANSEYNGMPPQSFAWSNSNDKGYFLSVVQLSGGYEFSISGKTKIQIEPYVKIPLQGIGQGSMPISSAGIYFGITHSFR
jgi:hypothetical protein